MAYPEDVEITPDEKLNEELLKLTEDCFRGMNDDLNTARTIASLFNLLKKINSLYLGQLQMSALTRGTFDHMRTTYTELVTMCWV
jgi:cysteinyl-tRNA synthetase